MARNPPGSPVVMVHQKRFGDAVVRKKDVHSVIAHRFRHQTEEYLVRWVSNAPASDRPYSWHPLHELAGADGLNSSSRSSCLTRVQVYLEGFAKEAYNAKNDRSLKRKSPDDHQVRLSPFDRDRDNSRVSSTSGRSDASTTASSADDKAEGAYNCELEAKKGTIYCIPILRMKVDTSDFPTLAMRQRASQSRYNVAASRIRAQFTRNLATINGPKVRLINTRDESTPSLNFKFINTYEYRDGVAKPDPDTMEGCGLVKTLYGTGQTCRPNMGQNCGCEYTRSCECLEYARVAENKLTPEEWAANQQLAGGEQDLLVPGMGLPKRFPYGKDTGYLVTYYLKHRFPIYECNEKCACGPGCKSRVVQKGRQVGLEIFRTRSRGWGLKSTQNLKAGQFIDTYRGEVITKDEGERRHKISGKGKDNYLFSLDKFRDEVDPIYEIDGQFFGGPTRFINHSCDPNSYIYVVSKDKNNPVLYEIAFFAGRDIDAGEELTFDYMDTDEGAELMQSQQDGDDDDDDKTPCLCGARNCRGWLWK